MSTGWRARSRCVICPTRRQLVVVVVAVVCDLSSDDDDDNDDDDDDDGDELFRAGSYTPALKTQLDLNNSVYWYQYVKPIRALRMPSTASRFTYYKNSTLSYPRN